MGTIKLEIDTIGARVRVVRAAKNISQYKLALMSGTNQMTISRIENDVPVHEEDLAKVLKALDIE